MSKFYISHFVADFETQATRSASSVFCLFDALKGETQIDPFEYFERACRGSLAKCIE